MPLEILSLSVFMINANGMFFRRPGALAMLQPYDIYVSLFEVCTRVRFQGCQRISFRRISVQSRVKKPLVIFQKLARNSAKDFCYVAIVGPKNKEGIKRKTQVEICWIDWRFGRVGIPFQASYFGSHC